MKNGNSNKYIKRLNRPIHEHTSLDTFLYFFCGALARVPNRQKKKRLK